MKGRSGKEIIGEIIEMQKQGLMDSVVVFDHIVGTTVVRDGKAFMIDASNVNELTDAYKNHYAIHLTSVYTNNKEYNHVVVDANFMPSAFTKHMKERRAYYGVQAWRYDVLKFMTCQGKFVENP